jgi:hypothetical protein
LPFRACAGSALKGREKVFDPRIPGILKILEVVGVDLPASRLPAGPLSGRLFREKLFDPRISGVFDDFLEVVGVEPTS